MSESVFLPKNVRPRKYTLFLDPSLETFEFQGKVTIDLDVVESCSAITFHADRLEIYTAELFLNGTPLHLGSSTLPRLDLDPPSQRATVSVGSFVLQPGPLQMVLTFKGILNDDMMGFYRASYQVDGKQQWMACTQFEAIGARRALPCWDEPSWKAVFEVNLAVPPGLIGLSNMPVVDRAVRADGKALLRYAATPVMSSYLLAFVVGDMERVSSRTKEGVEVNVYTIRGAKQQGQFAVEAASQLISFFADYFDIAYPLPKADLVAIPDFAAGAMENWGLVCFRDTALLLDQNSSSAAAFQAVAETVSHELAHQWFGNLVTMQWWSDLWLNEGFATWVGTLGVDHIQPNYGVWTQFVSSEMVKALETDALLSSHPVEVEINDPEEIEQVFDDLSYSKGASILRQLNAAVGPLPFQQGLRSYLSTHQYSNTVTNDLWKAVGAASGQPVETQMRGWTRQMGYPLITVQGRAPGGGLKLSQTRFLSKGLPTPREDSLWSVPVTAVVGGEMRTFILDEREGVAGEFEEAEGGWLKLNAEQVGFFRVNYPHHMWTALEEGVAAGEVGVLDRLGILMDAFALAKAGVLQTTQALQLALAYRDENEYTVWSQLSGSWEEVALLLSATPHLPAFQDVGLGLFLPIAERVGWEAVEGESHQAVLLRPLVLRKLAEYGHGGTIQKCRDLFQKMIKDPKSVGADLRYLVAAVAVMEGGREEFEAAKKLYREADVADFKEDCLFAMGYTQREELIEEYLEFGFDEREVKSQDTSYVLSILAKNDAGKELGWKYVKRNWEAIYARFHNSSGLFKRFVTAPISTFCTLAKAQDVESFFEANPVPEASMDLSRALENIKTRAAWLTRDHRSLVEWLAARK